MKIFRTAQLQDPAMGAAAPPPALGDIPAMPPAAPLPPDPLAPTGLGAPGLSAPPTDPMAGLPPSAPSERQEIIGPITSLSQIFYDMDVAKFIQNNLHIGPQKLTKKIWTDYGGKPDGKANFSNTGNRTEDNLKLSTDDASKERKDTEDSKWKRFEKNKTISDIISYDDLGKVVEGLIYGVIQKANASAAAPAGGAGGPMGGILASNKARIIIAKNLEKEGNYYLSDTIIKDLIKFFK